MTLEDFTRRLGTVLAMCSLGVLVIAFLCAMGGGSGNPEVATLHHLFGLTLAVLGLVLFAVGTALAALVPPQSLARTSSIDGSEVPDQARDTD